jgi:uncharacterized repeat protein (TIGR02543 family)
MRRSIYAIVPAVTAIFLLTLAGCDLMTGPESGQSPAQDGKAAVSLAIAGTEARTVAPANAELGDVAKWRLLGAKTGGGPQDLLLESADPASETLYLETGDWDFTLEGYNETPLLILEGTISKQTISLEGPNTLSFTVAPVLEGTGTVHITITLPEGHGITKAKVFKGGDELDPITPSANSVAYEADHAAGNYYFSFRLYKGGELYGVVSELVKVRANLTSEGTYALTAEDLNLSYLITFHLNEGAFEGAYPAAYRSTDADLTLPTPVRDGYTFKGWYDNEGLSNPAITAIPAESAGDKPFWAKWAGSGKAITGFTVAGRTGSIGGDSVTVTVPWGTPLTNLAPIITVSDKAIVNPASGVARNFTAPVAYTVTAEDESTAVWNVTVSWESLASGGIAAGIGNYLSSLPDDGTTAADPIILPPISGVNLADGGWAALLTAIQTAGKYVDLDLSACTGMTEFDPGKTNNGEKFIVSLVLPDTATSVKPYVWNNPTFKNFTSLKSVTGQNVQTIIGESIFRDCTSLETVSFPTATTIGEAAFYQCTSLETVSIPKAINIGYNAFSGCTALKEVSFPEVTSIGYSAFSGCTALKEVSLPEVTSIGGNYTFSNCYALTTVYLPKVTNITGNYTFSNCYVLTTVYLPKVTNIAIGTFERCYALKEVSLPEAANIARAAFESCSALEKVSLPKATTFENSVFMSTGTTALTVTLGSTAPSLRDAFFYNVTEAKTVTVQVPTGATGYGSLPATFSGVENETGGPHWGEGFRGKGWTGSAYNGGSINDKITLNIKYAP